MNKMTEVEPYDNQPPKTLNVNRYATKKTIAQGMLDIALLTANASQLKYVLQTGGNHPFYTLMLTLISLSIALQVVSGIIALTLNAAQDCRLHLLTNATFLNIINQMQLYSSFIVTGVTTGISILYIGTLNINKEKHCNRANILNNLITIQIFLISVINIVISAFGIEQVNLQQAADTKRALEAKRLADASQLISVNHTVIFNDSKL